TAPGSSGSPVFNDQWQVVALHHSGVPATDEQGRSLTVDGRVWTPDMPESSLKWKANEGVRVSVMVDALRSLGARSALVQELLDRLGEPRRAPEQQPVSPAFTIPPQRAGIGAAEVRSDGTLSLTIPLQISLRLGEEG